MKNVWEVCKFSDEIESGDLKLDKFAVELHELVSGKADPVYMDPEKFFKNTYLTVQMKNMVRDTLLRTSRGQGRPTTIIDTGFGGGKTHTLLLLYHGHHGGTMHITLGVLLDSKINNIFFLNQSTNYNT